ncbi:histidine kinase dimerization/phospho-acceptor domain-containing protein, partial [Sphaerisporangium sp. NPDC049002]|uniref:histidine kinase dimerization/phospho-acceptor domain-containing protein n=1 Tax=Sphaerisporangium sp. NPDC049002 TaxID=3155392 RepID=UPI0033F4F6F2
MAVHLRPRSIRGRFTLGAGILALIVFALLAAGFVTTFRTKALDHVFRDTQSVATGWAGSVNPGDVPSPAADVDLLQLVDSSGKVVGASAAAEGMPPLSKVRPPVNARIQDVTECRPAGGCVLLTAVRVPPLTSRVLWQDEPHFIYAGRAEPPILAGYRLEFIGAGATLLASALTAWVTWWLVGRTLRPVAAIRARTAEISVSDLSLRVPQPPGYDEIAQLARTSNETLARLEEAVEQQRYFASVVSHELRSPVAGLRIRLEEALMYPGEVEPRATFEAALTTTKRLQAIIDDVLTLAHLRTVAPAEPVLLDLNALVRDEVAARVHGPPVHADIAGEAVVLGHHIQLAGVLNNLLVNAQRHAESRVEVTARRSGDQADHRGEAEPLPRGPPPHD